MFQHTENGFTAYAHPHETTRKRHHGTHAWRVTPDNDPTMILAAGVACSQESAETVALTHMKRLSGLR